MSRRKSALDVLSDWVESLHDRIRDIEFGELRALRSEIDRLTAEVAALRSQIATMPKHDPFKPIGPGPGKPLPGSPPIGPDPGTWPWRPQPRPWYNDPDRRDPEDKPLLIECVQDGADR